MESCVLGDGRTMRVGDVVWGGVESGSVPDDFEGRHAVTWWPGKVSHSVIRRWPHMPCGAPWPLKLCAPTIWI